MDQLPDEVIVHIINDVSVASKLILVNKHLTELALEQIIITRNDHPAWKILQTRISKDNELVIDEVFAHYMPLSKTNAMLRKEAFTNMLASCFLSGMSFQHINIEIHHSCNNISLYDSNDHEEYVWGSYTCTAEGKYYYHYFEYTNKWEIFNQDEENTMSLREDVKPYFMFDMSDCVNIDNIFSSILPEISLRFWFPIVGNGRNEFYKFLHAGELPYPHPDIVTGPNAAKYRELYFAN
jgi:hypothetical protein